MNQIYKIMKGILKFLLFLFATLIVCAVSGNWLLFPFCVIELILLFAITSVVTCKSYVIGYILNVVLLFIYSAQLFIYYFTGEFISLLMLENVNMTASLGDSMRTYFLTALPFIVLLFLPISRLNAEKIKKGILIAVGALYVVSMVVAPKISATHLSPFSNTINLGIQSLYLLDRKVSDEEKVRLMQYFYRDSIPGAAPMLRNFKSQSPNVILMLTEGLSAEVLDFYNDGSRNLTPNLNELAAQSMIFDNYFNHTAATYRGVRGTLYSGYQMTGGYNNDKTGFGQISLDNLRQKMEVSTVSLVDMLKESGYSTCYVNPEPQSKLIHAYVSSFGVDTLVAGPYLDVKYLTDKQTFEVMEDVVLSLEKKEEPYLVICYNVGTHHGFDSSDVKYGDGSNPDLNKFYNFDYWFGKFFNKMKDAGVFDNTIFVFTADHAAYPAPEYCETFNTDRKDFIGRIPLFVYCTDIEPVRYDVGGRNSLSLAPTLMDLLGKTAYPNYFLGTSLFLQPESELNYMSAQGPLYHCTKGGTVVPVSNRDRRVKIIEAFCKIHVNE